MEKLLKSKTIKKSIFIILFIVSIIYVLSFLRPSVIDFDESYTLSLINSNWLKMIYFDSLDVHPPLYYLLLKSFIDITTFWTNSIPVEVIFSRLFSLLISVISFIFLYKLSIKFKLNNKMCVQWILMILLPNVLGPKFSTQQLIDIRMYSLSALFVILVFYYLIKFYDTNNNKFLIASVIFAVCATYTHYYAALFSGSFFVYYLIIAIRYKNIKIIKKLCISIIVLILSFFPWLPIFFKQVNNSTTYWMNNILEIKEVIEFFIIFILFLYPVYKYYKLNLHSFGVHLYAIIFVIIIAFLFSLIYSFIKKPIFQYRYMFPILLIYEFVSINILYKYIKYKHLYLYKFIIIILLLLNFSISLVDQVTRIYPTSILSVKIYNYWCKDYHHDITIKQSHNSYSDFNYVTYIPTINKTFIVPKSFKADSHIYNNKDYKITFNNVINKLKYK